MKQRQLRFLIYHHKLGLEKLKPVYLTRNKQLERRRYIQNAQQINESLQTQEFQDQQENPQENQIDDQNNDKNNNLQQTQKKKKTGPKLVVNTFNTVYPVVTDAAKNIGFRCKQVDPNLYINPYQQIEIGINANTTVPQPEEFDICWFDLAITPDILYRIKPYQRVSQWPGIQVIAHKNKLGKNLMQMRKEYQDADEYDFFPETYMLPYEMYEFKNQFKPVLPVITSNLSGNQQSEKEKQQNQQDQSKWQPPVFIIKPENQSQGRGIYLTRNPDEINSHDHVVAQKYISDPYLIDGLKFDLRIYVLLYGINPMKIYVFEDGLARFATTPYEQPAQRNLGNMFMHLTNYAINKNSDQYRQNESEEGTGNCHKRSLKQIYQYVQRQGFDSQKLKNSIDDLIIKTIITAQPTLWHIYRTCQPEDVENQLCFQILGFDVMLNSSLKPFLIEVNHAPSLATESAFDLNVKKRLVEDTIRILNLSMKRKLNYVSILKSQFQRRILTGKTLKLSAEEKEQKRLEIDKLRDEQEANLLGGYRMIYPCNSNQDMLNKYKKMLQTSKEIYEFFTSGKKIKDGNSLKTQREQEMQKEKDSRPPWRSTGAGTMPNWDKPSKYQLQNSNIKPKIFTGLSNPQQSTNTAKQDTD